MMGCAYVLSPITNRDSEFASDDKEETYESLLYYD